MAFRLLIATIILHLTTTSAAIGINYGTFGNLPPPPQVVRFFTPVYGVGAVRDGGQLAVQPAGGKWCVAKQDATGTQLQRILDWVCGHGGVDCKPLQPGGVCFEPDNVRAHANYVMNLYYQTQGRADSACDFSGTGVITANDPSIGDCKYIS